MPRNPLKKSEPVEDDLPAMPQPPQPGTQQDDAGTQIVEREVTLSLLNDKINYLTNVIHKIAKACECDTD